MATGNNSSFTPSFDSSKANLSEIKYSNMLYDSSNMYMLPSMQNYYLYQNSFLGKKRDEPDQSVFLQNQIPPTNNKGMYSIVYFFIFNFYSF